MKPIILMAHKKHLGKPIGKFISSEIKNGELTIIANINKDFLDKIKTYLKYNF